MTGESAWKAIANGRGSSCVSLTMRTLDERGQLAECDPYLPRRPRSWPSSAPARAPLPPRAAVRRCRGTARRGRVSRVI